MSLSSSENEDLELNEGSSDEQEVPADGDDSEAGEEVPAAAEDDTDDEMTVCDDGTYDTDEEPDVNASATESDEDDDEELDDEVDDTEDVPSPKKQNEKKVKKPTPSEDKIARITNTVKERYEKRQGLQLYIRFPNKLPEDLAEFQKLIKSLSELIVEGHKPRQKHARFCLVDFATTEDRDIALKELKKTQPQTKIVVSLPKIDSEDFIKTLIEKKLQQDYKKRAKQILRLESRKTVQEKEFTPIIRVMNIPKSASTDEIKALFPEAVDIQTKPAPSKFDGKMVATITLPSTTDAKKSVKRKLQLGGNDLIIKFNNNNKKKKKNNSNYKRTRNNRLRKTKPAGEPINGPSAPPTPAKRSISENENTGGAAKKAKIEASRKGPKNGQQGGGDAAKKAKLEVSAKGAKNSQQGGKGKGKKKPFPPNKGKPAPNKKPGGKPNKQNKQKKQPQKKGKGVVAPAAE